jgi:glyceraldehyde-3-phosphate dehydrogenase (NADP+)
VLQPSWPNRKCYNNSVTDGGFVAQFRRCPIGVVLCVGPFNYPFNETYTTLIPALVMGNTVVMKMPRTGVLCHWPTLPLFRDCFPPGVVNIISGSGRAQVRLFSMIGPSSCRCLF